MNPELYNAAIKQLTNRGVSQESAHKAAEVVASDVVGKKRTAEQQASVNQAMKELNI
jgi:hypothetical protein